MKGSVLGFGWLRGPVAKSPPARCAGAPGSVSLAQGMLWSHRLRSREQVLTCHEGQVWLTREGDAEDHILSAGDSLRLEQPGLVVVQALRPACFELSQDTRPEDKAARHLPFRFLRGMSG